MPVYNEEKCIEIVVKEWIDELNRLSLNYKICILNDGSKDNTLKKLTGLKEIHEHLIIVDKENSGHGQSCILGYKIAIENGADWVFQIDSDGQCDIKYFEYFINHIYANNTSLFGNRKTRDDGFKRLIISKFVTLFVLIATGVYVKDANVPYRLMPTNQLKNIIHKIPTDFYLANILVSVLLQNEKNIKWKTIHFKNRIAGTPSVKTFSFIKHGFKLYKQLRKAIK